MNFKKRYFKIEIYEHEELSMTLLGYSRIEFIIRWHFNKILKNGIKLDNDNIVTRDNIDFKIEKISAQEACDIANIECDTSKYKYIVENDKVKQIEI